MKKAIVSSILGLIQAILSVGRIKWQKERKFEKEQKKELKLIRLIQYLL